MGQIGFYHGSFADSYEKQANEQGYTLGDKADYFVKIADAYNRLRIGGFLTDSQADSVCKKIQQRLAASVKPLSKSE